MAASAARTSRLAILLVVLGAVIVGNALVTYSSIGRLIAAEQWVRHTLQVELALDQALTAVVGAERAARGFVLTGDREFMDQYSEAVAEAQAAAVSVETLTRDNRVQQARREQFRARMHDVLSGASTLISMRSAGNLERAMRKAGGGEGYASTNAFKSLVHEMRRDEEALLVRRTNISSRIADRAVLTLIVVTLHPW